MNKEVIISMNTNVSAEIVTKKARAAVTLANDSKQLCYD